MGLAAAAVVGAVATVGSSVIGASAAGKAANAQSDAAKYAADLQQQQYNQTRTDMTPWREAGGKAIGQLSDMLKPGYDYTTSPGYQFRFNEGLRALDSSAASKGLLLSGGQVKAAERYGQGIGADDFDRSFNRVASVASGGQQVNTTLGQLGQQAASNAGNAVIQGGQARASGYIGQANAINNGIGNLSYLAMNSGLFGGGGGGGGYTSNPASFLDNGKFGSKW